MARSGTSITMDRDVLRWIDERVKTRVFASRNHAFEYAVRHPRVGGVAGSGARSKSPGSRGPPGRTE